MAAIELQRPFAVVYQARQAANLPRFQIGGLATRTVGEPFMRMTMVMGLAMLFGAGAAIAGDPKGDLDKLQGSWIAEKDGKKAEFKFTKDAFTFEIEGFGLFKGTFKVDTKKTPKHMDLTVKEGPMFEGQTALAIYDLDGDTFKWCANEPGKDDRAAAFPEKDGEGHLYLIFKRVKK